MYKLSVIAVAMLASQAANAVDVYKADDSSVNLYGKVYAGHVYGDAEKSKHYGSNEYVRFGAKANSKVTDSLKAFMHYEIQMYFGDSEKIEKNTTEIDSGEKINESTGNLRVRLAYAGMEGGWGKLSFGRNYGASELVSDWTDQHLSDPFTQDALGVGSDQKGTARSSSLLKYQGAFGRFAIDGSIKLRNTAVNNNSDYGIAAAYNFDFGLSLGTSYSVEVADIFDEEDASKPKQPELIIAGIKYQIDGFYSALNYAQGINFKGSDVDHSGIEVALGYDFDNGITLRSVYNKGEAEPKDGKKYDFADNITAGVKYQLNKPFSVLVEYRFENLSDSEEDKNDDEVALAVVYAF